MLKIEDKMALINVKKEIIRKAESDSEKILGDAKAKTQDILNAAKEKQKVFAEKKDLELQNTIETKKKRDISQAKLGVKKDALDAKKQILNQAFELAEEKIEKFSDKKKQDLIKKLLDAASKEICFFFFNTGI